MAKIAARKGMPDVQLSKEEFSQRFRNRFFDPAFEGNEAAQRPPTGRKHPKPPASTCQKDDGISGNR